MEIFEKLNLEKADKNYYQAKKNPEIRDLDPYYYLTVSGRCSPDHPAFTRAIEQLYSVAYGIKFLCKAQDLDFVVPKMEGFWWIDGGPEAQHLFPKTPKEEWNWKIIIRMPDFVEQEIYDRALAGVMAKKPELNADRVNYELINEGRCVQILHLGSYDQEEPTIMKLLDFVHANDLKIANHHHEIYLSDPRRVAPEKLRTILRYAVK